jgi:hypothetical protein
MHNAPTNSASNYKIHNLKMACLKLLQVGFKDECIMSTIARSECETSHERPSTTIHTAIRANILSRSFEPGPFFRISPLERIIGQKILLFD